MEMLGMKKRNYTQKFNNGFNFIRLFPEAFESLNIVDTNSKRRNITEAFIALG